ncbi:hypothetical protein SMICM17S_12727 [Streptomyces microflavus]
MATGIQPDIHLGPEHTVALGLCEGPMSVAEIAAHLRLPAVVTKVLLSDLVRLRCGHRANAPAFDDTPDGPGPAMEAVLDGLRRQL